MALERYNRKRDFDKTPEPRGKARIKEGRSFVVQKHDASRLHYDFRIEIGGVLVSWAVPKGPSLDPSHKRLAVHVEDHPLEYGTFEGVIPKGQYGGGTVMLWDRGRWAPDEGDPTKAIKRGKLSFTLEGERLRGGWTLTRLRSRNVSGDDRDNWLLIKRDDEHAAPEEGDSSVPEDRSIESGRTMREIAEGEGARKDRNRKKSRTARPKAPAISAVDGARKAPLPRSLSPQLCTLTDEAPRGEEWLHEIKFDGYRLVARRTARGVHLLTRTGKDWTAKFTPLAEAVAKLPVETAIIDGETTILDPRGHSSFQKLQNAIKARTFDSLAYYAFDLMYLDGYDLTRSPLVERKRLLRAIVPETDTGILRYSDHVLGGGGAVHENACELALEGIISKRTNAPYEQARSKLWLKIKCARRQEFVVIGWTPPSGSRKHFGSLLLGAYDADGTLTYCGKVGTGFTEQSLKEVKRRLDAFSRKTCPADEPPSADEGRGARWVKPELVAEVAFTQWTDDGRLRHPAFQGLREDKPARKVRVEEPTAVKEVADVKPKAKPSSNARSGRARAEKDDASVAGVRLSSPDRVLYPDQNVTKLDLARYYERVAEWILPHITGRPLSTVRCPQGRTGQCFFQKHIRETFTEPVRAIRIEEESGSEAEYIAVDSVEGLITLVQFGVLEIHPWGSMQDDPDTPGLITFDLDPGEGVAFEAVKEGAVLVRERLESIGLTPFLKTTGGKGLHVVAPLSTDDGWDEVKALCAGIAKAITAEQPDRYIATASKAKRKGKVFLDYLRNGRGATAVSPYSTRARPGATVAVPLRWDELGRLDAPDRYTIANVTRRLASMSGDPWEGFESARSSPAPDRVS